MPPSSIRATASAPVPTVSTSSPLARSPLASIAAIFGSSSTTSTLAVT